VRGASSGNKGEHGDVIRRGFTVTIGEGPDTMRRQALCCGHQEERWWRRRGLNPRPPRCERGALPAELLPHLRTGKHFRRYLPALSNPPQEYARRKGEPAGSSRRRNIVLPGSRGASSPLRLVDRPWSPRLRLRSFPTSHLRWPWMAKCRGRMDAQERPLRSRRRSEDPPAAPSAPCCNNCAMAPLRRSDRTTDGAESRAGQGSAGRECASGADSPP
jgi:hypothetical protein